MSNSYVYDGSILHFGTTGNLTANVTSNSVTLAIEVSMSLAGCKLKMDEAKITDFGPIVVQLTGLYPFDGLSSVIAEKVSKSASFITISNVGKSYINGSGIFSRLQTVFMILFVKQLRKYCRNVFRK